MANLSGLCYISSMKNRDFPNVTLFKDRHGKERARYRKKGSRPYSFKAPYGSPLFREEYSRIVGGVRPIHRNPLKLLAGMDLIYFIGPYSGPIKIGRTRNLYE